MPELKMIRAWTLQDGVPEWIGVADVYESATLYRRHRSVGAFELSLPFTANNSYLFQAAQYLEFVTDKDSDANPMQLPFVGIVRTRSAETGAGNKLMLKLSGDDFSGVAKQRIMLPYPRYLGDAVETGTNNPYDGYWDYPPALYDSNHKFVEDGDPKSASVIMEHIVANAFADKHNSKRNLSYITYDGTQCDVPDGRYRAYMTDTCAAALEGASEVFNLGWRFAYDLAKNQIYFIVLTGKDRSDSVLFSADFGNEKDVRYVLDTTDARNVGYYLGKKIEDTQGAVQGDGRTYMMDYTEAQEPAGLERYENLYDVGQIVSDTISARQTNGRAQMAKSVVTESYSADAVQGRTFDYRIDYENGDIVTRVDNRLGIMMQTRIIETEEYYQHGGNSVVHKFGSVLPNVADQIRRAAQSAPYKGGH